VDVECVCSFAGRKRLFLGTDLFEASKLTDSPLCSQTAFNVIVTSPWSALLPHLRLSLGRAWHYGELENKPFTFKTTTDEQVLRASLARDKDSDLYDSTVGRGSLLIVRLGFLGWRNVAAAGYLHEALRFREFEHKAIWLTDTPDVPFEKGHLSWSPELDGYIADNFEKVVLA
jgi:hypothetical protein